MRQPESSMASGKRLSQAQAMLSTSKRKFELVDPDILECPICSDDLAPPVYQCPSGHTTCASCWEKIPTKCPSCQESMGYNRNIAVEKILESLRVSCKNTSYGCNEMLKYTKKAEHESTLCEYQPFYCVFDGCNFQGSIRSLPLHFKEEHQVETVNRNDQFTMKPTDDYIFVHDHFRHHLLVVHREKQDFLGDKFFCASFGTFSGWLKLVVTIKDGPSGSYAMETQGCDIQRGDHEWKRNFLLVPQSAHGLGNCEFRGQLDMPTVFKRKCRFAPEFDD